MANTSQKKKSGFGKLLLWVVILFVALHIFTDGEFTDDLLEIFDKDEPSYTVSDPTINKIPTNTTGNIPTNTTGSIPTNTTTGVTQPDLLPSVPEALRNHVYLGWRGQGYCEELTGNATITVIFVSDPEGAWTDSQINAVKTDMQSTVSRITSDAAGYGAQVNISLQYRTTSTIVKIQDGDTAAWVNSALTSLGLPDRTGINPALESTYGVDSAPVIFVANHGGRAKATLLGSGNEYAVLYENADSFYHELCHIYGAQDFYYPNDVKTLTQTYIPNSIMVDSSEGVMEEFTAYLIGWTDTLAPNALDFLNATAYLTSDYLAAEKEKETYTGYVTNFTYDGGTYTGYLVDGVKHGQGKWIRENGTVWEGTFDHGVFSGAGNYIYPSGDTYTGQWLNGKRHGTGTYTWASGGSYTGTFVENERTGSGSIIYSNGSTYVGECLKGLRHGTGKLTYRDGSVYDGTWSEGKRHGKGTYTDADGNVYIGDWVADQRNGQAVVYYANGNVYSGSWVNDKWNGQGSFTWASGDKYVGEYVDGYRHGYGIYYYPSGTRYEGYWENGEINGQGTMYYANGTIQSGLWSNGSFVG